VAWRYNHRQIDDQSRAAKRIRLRGWSYKLSPREVAEGRMQHRFGPAVMLREPLARAYMRDCDDVTIESLRSLLIARNPDALMTVGQGYTRRKVWRRPRYQPSKGESWLAISAAAGHPRCIYLVGAQYDMGEAGYPFDPARALEYFRRAAALGHAHSEWICGTCHLEGSSGAVLDPELAIQMIKRAAAKKFDGALRMLADFHEKGLHGFEKDLEKAACYRRAMNAADVIGYT
jgi:TPR repeat protein